MTDQTELVILLKRYIAARDSHTIWLEHQLYAQLKKMVGATPPIPSGPTKSVKVGHETVPVLPAESKDALPGTVPAVRQRVD